MKDKIINLIKKIKDNRKWRIYFYYREQCIGSKLIDKDFAPMDNIYVIKTKKGLKHLVGTNKKVQMVMRPIKYKYCEDKKRRVHIEVVPFEGVDLE